jgi:hypothetical protein
MYRGGGGGDVAVAARGQAGAIFLIPKGLGAGTTSPPPGHPAPALIPWGAPCPHHPIRVVGVGVWG